MNESFKAVQEHKVLDVIERILKSRGASREKLLEYRSLAEEAADELKSREYLEVFPVRKGREL